MTASLAPRGPQLVYSMEQDPKNWIKDYDPENNKEHQNIDMMKIHLDFWLNDNG